MYFQTETQQLTTAELARLQDANSAQDQTNVRPAMAPTETPTAHVQMAISTNLFWQLQAPTTVFDAQI